MKLQIDRRHIEPMMQAFPRLAFLREQLRFGNRVEIAFNRLEDGELDLLHSLYVAGDSELRARAAQIATLRQALHEGGKRFEPEELEICFGRWIRRRCRPDYFDFGQNFRLTAVLAAMATGLSLN